MSAAAPAARAEAALARPRRRHAGSRRGRARPGVDRGVLWIAGLAVLLAGVVAVNVAVLQLNVRLDEYSRERVRLRDENARLRGELSSTVANARIGARARTELGLVEADPTTTAYVRLPGP